MSFYGWKPYVSVAERRAKAEKAAAKARKAGADLSPVTAARGAIAKTFWGKAWCDNLEHYSDYANRLPRGRTYVRNGSVIDLRIMAGEIQAQVMGSSLYKVAVSVTAVPEAQWQSIGTDCAGSIDSMVELLQGKLSRAVMERISTRNTGLFPTPKEIRFGCTCPDSAAMCKHVAAVLYGVGARLDEQPELIFRLRRVDAQDLVRQAGAGLPKPKRGPAAGKVLDESLLADVFGIEMADAAPPAPTASPRRKAVTRTAAATRARAATTRKPRAILNTDTPGALPAVEATVPAKPSADARRTPARQFPASTERTAGATTVAKGKAATKSATVARSAKDSTATEAAGTPAKAAAATRRKPPATAPTEVTRKTEAIRASASPRKSPPGRTAPAKKAPESALTAKEGVIRSAKEKSR